MLSISHGLTGAFLASNLPVPYVYTPLIFAAHYLQDWIPHWDVGTGLSNGSRKRQTAILLELIDLALTIGLVYWLFQAGKPNLQLHTWLGAAIGLLPDFIEAPRNFLRIDPKILRPFNEVHGLFHHSTPNIILGLLPQVATILLIIFWR